MRDELKKKIHIIPDLDNLAEYIKYAGDNGFHFEYNDFFIPDVLDDSELIDKTISLYNNADDLPQGNTLHGAFLDVTIFSSDKFIRENSRKRVRQSMEIALKLGARAVVLHTNFIPNYIDDNYKSIWITENASFIRELLKEYPELNIYMENMFDMNPNMLKGLCEELEDEEGFGVCFDYAHACVFGTVMMKEWVDAIGKYVKHLHINDNNLVSDQHLAIGDGFMDYSEFFQFYNESFPNATILIEVRGMDKIKKSITTIESILAKQ